MKKLLLPRGYLSHTQIDMWRRNPDHYVQKYVYGDEDDATDAQIFGKMAANSLEKGYDGPDVALDAYSRLMPKYEVSEHELRVTLKTPAGSVDLLGKMDTFRPSTLAFREHKTGRVPWTQAKANNHPQLKQYAAMIWLAHKKLPASIHLDWAQTEYIGQEVTLTGMIKSFEVKLTLGDVLEYMALAGRVAQQIDERYRQELKKIA